MGRKPTPQVVQEPLVSRTQRKDSEKNVLLVCTVTFAKKSRYTTKFHHLRDNKMVKVSRK